MEIKVDRKREKRERKGKVEEVKEGNKFGKEVKVGEVDWKRSR